MTEKFEVRIGSPSKSLFMNLYITKKFPTETLLEMIDSSLKSLGKLNMTIEILYNIKKFKFGRKIRSEGYFLLPLYINWSVTKKFPIKALSEMIDSSVKSLGEVEYDNQN